MAVIRALYRILPEKVGDEVINSIINKIHNKAEKGIFKVINYRKEPVAFGLYCLLILIEFEEKEGLLNEIEFTLSSINGVKSLEAIKVSRI